MGQMDIHLAVNISTTQDFKRTKSKSLITLTTCNCSWASRSLGRLTRRTHPNPSHLSDVIIIYELNNKTDVRIQGNVLLIKITKDKVECNGLRLREEPCLVPGKHESTGCPEEKK